MTVVPEQLTSAVSALSTAARLVEALTQSGCRERPSPCDSVSEYWTAAVTWERLFRKSPLAYAVLLESVRDSPWSHADSRNRDLPQRCVMDIAGTAFGVEEKLRLIGAVARRAAMVPRASANNHWLVWLVWRALATPGGVGLRDRHQSVVAAAVPPFTCVATHPRVVPVKQSEIDVEIKRLSGSAGKDKSH